MILRAYSIRDLKSGLFSQPFFFLNEFVAVRSFAVTASDPSSMVHRFPADFQLFWVGEFDDGVGLLTSRTPELVGDAATVLRLQRTSEEA